MKKAALVMSGKYVTPSLRNEFGNIPPSFLPFKGGRLFEAHAKVLRANGVDKLYMSIPSGYTINPIDYDIINKCGFELIEQDPSLTIGDSFFASLNVILKNGARDCFIMFGDASVEDTFRFERNSIYTSQSSTNFNWGVPTNEGCIDEIYSGLMRITLREDMLIDAMTQENLDFPDLFGWLESNCGASLVSTKLWKDLGNTSTFFHSSIDHLKSRHFNNLEYGELVVSKFSEDHNKINAEIKWYACLPAHMKVFTPQFIGKVRKNNKLGYTLEILHQPTLAALAVYGELPRKRWDVVFKSCRRFIELTTSDAENKQFKEALIRKTTNRLMDLDSCSNFSLRKGLLDQVIAVTEVLFDKFDDVKHSYAHGDFCFSNIFFNTRNENIKVIDPRGKSDDFWDALSSPLYDVAKLAHSVIGGYDLIVQNRFFISRVDSNEELVLPDLDTEHWIDINAAFVENVIKASPYTIDQIKIVCVHLFLSMLPLHSDNNDRQKALYLNALRLIDEIKL